MRNIEGLKLGHGWNRGLKMKTNCVICGKKMDKWRGKRWLNENKTCSKECKIALIKEKRKLQITTFDTRVKMSLSAKKVVAKRIANGTWIKTRTGAKNPQWKGGISLENRTLRQSPEYRSWRFQVFSRDYWTCQICGYKGRDIEADHIKKWSEYPELRFDINNGRTLCKFCHKMITFSQIGSTVAGSDVSVILETTQP